MKKYILSLLIGTALLSSCLDVDIVDRVEKEDGFFKTEDHALAASASFESSGSMLRSVPKSFPSSRAR